MSERGQKFSNIAASHIMPRDKGAAPLDFVIAVMALLAALALGSSMIAARAAEGWSAGLSDRLTIQVPPPDSGDVQAGLDAEVRAALAVLQATQGIAQVRVLSDGEIAALVEPWIGNSGVVAGIPLPRLIDATVAPGASMDMPALQERLKLAAPHAVVDDHSRWLTRLAGLAGTVRCAAFDRGRNGRGGHAGDTRWPGRASRDGGAAAPDGREGRLHRAQHRMALFHFRAAGVAGG